MKNLWSFVYSHAVPNDFISSEEYKRRNVEKYTIDVTVEENSDTEWYEGELSL